MPNTMESLSAPLASRQRLEGPVSELGKWSIGGLIPGILLAALITLASLLTEWRFGGPVMLYALVIGAVFNPVSEKANLSRGLSFSASCILKIGIALLGVKITLIDVAQLGFQTAGLVVAAVAATLLAGQAIGRMMGLSRNHAIISAGSVAICGSAAALAIASVLPQDKNTQCHTILTIIVVTTLSTIAMIAYPALAALLSLTDTQAGIYMGVSIHNVAQVVGAGFIVSDSAGETATIVKLMRVACLLPVICMIGFFRKGRVSMHSGEKRPAMLPLFMIAFVIVMLANSAGFIPVAASPILSDISRWALVMAVAALGVKTSVKDIIGVGAKPILVLSLQTVFLAAFAFIAISFFLAL